MFFGSTAWQASDPETDELSAATAHDMTFDGTVANGWFGAALASARDGSGGFMHNLLIGAPGKWDSGSSVLNGAVYQFNPPITEDAAVIALGTPGVSFSVAHTSGSPGVTSSPFTATAHRLLHGAGAGDFFGRALAFVGDVDGVSGQEFLVGAPEYNVELHTPWSFSGAGYVSLFSLGSSAPLVTISGTQIPAPHTPGEGFGFSVAGDSDFDGDEIPDLVVGAPLFTIDSTDPGGGAPYGGRVMVFSGADAALGTVLQLFSDVAPNNTLLVGESAGGQFGGAVGIVADLDADGIDEIIVGAWQQKIDDSSVCGPAGRTNFGGAAYLISTGISTPGDVLVKFYGEAAKDHLGRAVGSAQLFGTGGLPEIVLSGVAWSPPGTAYPPTPQEVGRGYVWDGGTVLQ